MRKNNLILCILLILILASKVVNAQNVKDLYYAKVSVASQKVSVRSVGLEDALARVLIKVSGNGQIINNPFIDEKLTVAESLVNEYGYSKNEDEKLFLWAVFDETGVNKLLRNASIPIWGEERPLIVPWIVVEDINQQKHILTEERDTLLANIFKKAARNLGLPLVFPLMDLTDMAEVNLQEIQAANNPVLLKAGKRYGSDALLVGEIMFVDEGVRMLVSLSVDESRWRWDLTAKTPQAAFTVLAGRMAGILSAHYATEESPKSQNMHLSITGIKNSADMTSLTRYFQQLATVIDADILQVTGSSAVFNLRLNGTMSAFKREISVGRRLVPLSTKDQQYEWRG